MYISFAFIFIQSYKNPYVPDITAVGWFIVQCPVSSVQNSVQGPVQCPVSCVYCLVSGVQCLLSSVQCPWSSAVSRVQCPASIVQCPVFSVFCPVSIVHGPVLCPGSSVLRLLSSVQSLLSRVRCPCSSAVSSVRCLSSSVRPVTSFQCLVSRGVQCLVAIVQCPGTSFICLYCLSMIVSINRSKVGNRIPLPLACPSLKPLVSTTKSQISREIE